MMLKYLIFGLSIQSSFSTNLKIHKPSNITHCLVPDVKIIVAGPRAGDFRRLTTSFKPCKEYKDQSTWTFINNRLEINLDVGEDEPANLCLIKKQRSERINRIQVQKCRKAPPEDVLRYNPIKGKILPPYSSEDKCVTVYRNNLALKKCRGNLGVKPVCTSPKKPKCPNNQKPIYIETALCPYYECNCPEPKIPKCKSSQIIKSSYDSNSCLTLSCQDPLCSENTSTCGPTSKSWSKFNSNTWFQVINNRKSWGDAQFACKKMNKNANLAGVLNLDEQNFISKLVKSNSYSLQNYWLGGLSTSGKNFAWVGLSEKLNFNMWRGEPQYGYGEKYGGKPCLAMKCQGTNKIENVDNRFISKEADDVIESVTESLVEATTKTSKKSKKNKSTTESLLDNVETTVKTTIENEVVDTILSTTEKSKKNKKKNKETTESPGFIEDEIVEEILDSMYDDEVSEDVDLVLNIVEEEDPVVEYLGLDIDEEEDPVVELLDDISTEATFVESTTVGGKKDKKKAKKSGEDDATTDPNNQAKSKKDKKNKNQNIDSETESETFDPVSDLTTESSITESTTKKSKKDKKNKSVTESDIDSNLTENTTQIAEGGKKKKKNKAKREATEDSDYWFAADCEEEEFFICEIRC